MARDYRVELDIYNGPLDLLLYLIRRDEIDVYDIPIAEITEQFLSYLEIIQKLDLNVAGEFLVMASTLMQIKTRMLLPQPEGEEEEEEDPRMELVRQLIEYRKFKEAAGLLGDRMREHAKRFPRVGEDWPREKAPDDADGLRDVDLWTLLDAFTKLMKETLGDSERIIVDDETPLHDQMVEVIEMLRGPGHLRFEDLFRARRDRAYMIGIFLALLELVRQRKIRIRQESDFGPILVVLINADISDLILPDVEPPSTGEAIAASEEPETGVGERAAQTPHDSALPPSPPAETLPQADEKDGNVRNGPEDAPNPPR